MGLLSNEEIVRIQHYLDNSGLTYEPLKEELTDHMISDLERYLGDGLDFQQAWEKVLAEVPKDHFKSIQADTLGALNKNAHSLKLLISLSFFLLTAAAFFKLLHFPGSIALLVMALIAFAFTIGLSFRSDFYAFSVKKERRLLVLVAGLSAMFIASVVFNSLKMPIAIVLRYISVPVLMVLFPILSFHFYRAGEKAEPHALIITLNKNGRYLGYAVLALLGTGLLFTVISPESSTHIALLFFLLALIIAGLYHMGLTWKLYVLPGNDQRKAWMKYFLLASVVAFILFMLPALPGIFKNGGLSLLYTSLVIYSGMAITYAGWLSIDDYRPLLAGISFLLLLLWLIKLLLLFGLFDPTATRALVGILASPEVIIAFFAILGIFYRSLLFRAYMLLNISLYLFDLVIIQRV